ncbi:MAG: translation elongation factor Ts [candidate division Zixibacteria bacterium]|nr:translation elongation factor Ts [candidate division Zixibacteria bacterium]
MEIDSKLVKELRDKTGAPMMDCKRALEKANGNLEKALDYLREQGVAKASQKAGRSTREGLIYSYIHPGEKLGVLLEINCETDFVTRTDDFRNLAKDVAMQVAASNPIAIKRDDFPAELLEKEKEIYKAQVLKEGKPEKILDKIIQGKLEKYFQEFCLLEQPFIKDEDRTVKQRIDETIAKLGENITVKGFVRFRLGE